MKVNEFILKYKIKPALAAGFKSHIRAEDNTNMPETDMINQYRDFSGVQLTSDPVKTGNNDEIKTGNVVETIRELSLPVIDNTDVKAIHESSLSKKEKK